MDDKTVLREYRRGNTYRHGNISENKFLSELRFSKITYSKSLSEEEKVKGLNYTYDALYDLSDILDVSPFILSLRDNEGKKTVLHIGQKVDNCFDLLSNLEGNLGYHWFKFLDAFLGLEENCFDGAVAHLSEYNGFYSTRLKKVLTVLKYRRGLPSENEQVKEDVKKYIDNIMEIIDSMPLLDVETPEEYNTLEKSRDTFIRDMNIDTYKSMKNLFASYGAEISAPDNLVVIESLSEINRINMEYMNSNVDLVDTDYYKLAKRLDFENKTKKYTEDIELLSYAFNYYLFNMLKLKGNYNNFLCSSSEDNLLKIENKLEENAIYNAFEEFLGEILPVISENLYMIEEEEQEQLNEDLETEKTNGEDNVGNSVVVEPLIDKELDEDKDKFKITLFKKLLKENGISYVEDVPVVSSCHYVTINNSYIKYIKPPVRLYSQDKNQCIVIDCIDKEKNAKVHEEYVWDYALDYNDLVNYIVKLHKAHKNKAVVDEQKGENKFEIMKFREACKSEGLKIKDTNSRANNGFCNFEFDMSKGSGIRNVITKETYINGKNRAVVKLKDSSNQYIEWVGAPNYISLAKEISSIEKGQVEVTEPAEDLVAQREKNMKNKEILMEMIDPKDISSKEDLRKRMIKYINVVSGMTMQPYSFDDVINIIKQEPNFSQINFIVGSISKGEEEGKSKAWKRVSNSQVIIARKPDDRKMIEGAIESFVTILISSIGATETQQTLYIEGLTYMLCKYLRLDVRTYCQGKEFDKLIKNKNVLKKYLTQLFRMYMPIVGIFKSIR